MPTVRDTSEIADYERLVLARSHSAAGAQMIHYLRRTDWG